MTPYPPQTLQGDPIALYGRPDEAGAGPLTLLQSAPAAGDSVIRNENGYWVNVPDVENFVSVLGNLRQTGETGRPARSNVGSMQTFVDGALAGTGVGAFVPIPVAVGDVVTAVNLPIGATAGETITHQFAALYAGTGAEPAFIEQSTDTTNAAIAEKVLASWTLTKPVIVTAAMAPHGFIYAEVSITASGKVPTAWTYGTPAGTNYKVGSNGPLFFSFTAGTALGATAATKIESAAAKVVAPVIILT